MPENSKEETSINNGQSAKYSSVKFGKNSKERNSNNSNDKKIFITLLAIILVIIIAILIMKFNKKEPEERQNETNTIANSYVEEVEDGIKLNKSTKLNEAKEVEGLQISNIQLTTKDGMTTLLADVKNITDKKTEVKAIEITLLKEDGSEIAKLIGIINEIEAGESTQLNIATTSDYVNAYDFEVNIH